MSNDLAAIQQPTPMQLMQFAVERDNGIDVIERLAKLQADMQAHSDMVAFNEAMNRCQKRMKRISADMENPQTRSRYASYQQIDRQIRPIYTEEGLSLSFSQMDCPLPEHIRVICYVSLGGYMRTYQKDMPIVTTGSQGKAMMTATHAHGAADSYAKRYLVKDIFNLAIGEDDDDGNGDGVKIPSAKVGEWQKAIMDATTLEECKKEFGKAYTTANEMGDHNALNIIISAYETRKEDFGA